MNRKDFFKTLIGGSALVAGVKEAEAELHGLDEYLIDHPDLDKWDPMFIEKFEMYKELYPDLYSRFDSIYPDVEKLLPGDGSLVPYEEGKLFLLKQMSDAVLFMEYAGINAGRTTVNDLTLSQQIIRGKEYSVLTWDCGTAILKLDPRYV